MIGSARHAADFVDPAQQVAQIVALRLAHGAKVSSEGPWGSGPRLA
jgi:hypothetical protein